MGIAITTISLGALWWTSDIFWTSYPTAADPLNDKLWARVETIICATRWPSTGRAGKSKCCGKIAWNNKFTLQQIVSQKSKTRIAIKHVAMKHKMRLRHISEKSCETKMSHPEMNLLHLLRWTSPKNGIFCRRTGGPNMSLNVFHLLYNI